MKQSVPFQYAYSVLNGDIIVGDKIKKAVERFFNLIENAESKGYYLDHESGMRIIRFFPTFLKHTAGDLAGQPFHLQPHQQFTYYNILAWKKTDTKGREVRLIRNVYEKVARKNGKTAGKSGLGLFFQRFDGEEGADIRVGATMEKQAKILWKQAVDFIKKSPLLQHCGFKTYQSEIKVEENLSVFAPVSKEAKTLDGLKPSVVLLDEYHAHTTDDVRNVLQSGMGNRLHPLFYIITTAGVNPFGVCKQYEDVCVRILNGDLEDDSTFIMIHDLDPEDDWENEENWYKANPNLGVSVSLDYLRDEYIKAKNQPSLIPNFKTKHLNMWVDAIEIWIPNEIWKKNEVEKIPIEKFNEFGSYSAIDLSSTTDITADAFLSEPDENDIRYLEVYMYCPEETIDKRSKEDKVPYRFWRDQGYLISTSGNVCDYSVIEDNHIMYCGQNKTIRTELDKWNATSTATNLMEQGLEVSYFSQAISNMSFPTKQFEKLIYEGKIKYKYNPVLEWMLSGCVRIEDANGNVKIHKGKSQAHGKRIDGIIASIMALGGSLSMKEPESKYSKPMDPNEIVI